MLAQKKAGGGGKQKKATSLSYFWRRQFYKLIERGWRFFPKFFFCVFLEKKRYEWPSFNLCCKKWKENERIFEVNVNSSEVARASRVKAKYLSNWLPQKKKNWWTKRFKGQKAYFSMVSSHFVGKHMAFLAPSLVSASYSNSFALPPSKKGVVFLPSHPNAEPLRPLLHLLVQDDRVGPGVGRHLLGGLALPAAAAGAVLDLAEPGGKGIKKKKHVYGGSFLPEISLISQGTRVRNLIEFWPFG